MKSKYPKIFEPITIKRMTIKNRVAMTPMGTNYGETSGEMSNRHMNYYSLRAKGGTGLIILENANIEYPVGSNGTSQIRIDHDSFMPRYYQLVENLHKNGAMVAIQVNHAGASASSARTGVIPTTIGDEVLAVDRATKPLEGVVVAIHIIRASKTPSDAQRNLEKRFELDELQRLLQQKKK